MVNAQGIESASISNALLQNSNIVIREYDVEIVIKSDHKIIEKNKQVITILNETGKEEVNLLLYYNQLRNIKTVSAKLYNAKGKKEKQVGKAQMYDAAVSLGSTMVTDTRYLSYNFDYHSYPYTIEYEYTLEYTQGLFLPILITKPYKNCSVEKLDFSIENISGQKVAGIILNDSNKYEMFSLDSNVFNYSISNLLADQNNSVFILKLSEFEIFGNKGSTKNWKSIGTFYYNLNKNRDDLPQKFKDKLIELTAGLNDTSAKIKAVYHLLQNEYRYISIQLGIGGWQCTKAEEVYKYGYSDCKGLSNLMVAMLNAINIKANVCLVYGNVYIDNVLPEFPSSHFNHVIVCVPLRNDSIWLECTSPDMMYNYLGRFTNDKFVLLVDSGNSKLIRTPKNYGDTISVISKYNIFNDTVLVEQKNIYSNDIAISLFPMIKQNQKKEMKDFLLNEFTLGSRNVLSYNYKLNDSIYPQVCIQFESKMPGIKRVSDRRIYIHPLKTFNTSSYISYANKYSLLTKLVYIENIEMEIPKNYFVEQKLEAHKIVSQFGTFEINYFIDDKKVIMNRKYTQLPIEICKSNNSLFDQFKNQIVSEFNSDIVLVKR